MALLTEGDVEKMSGVELLDRLVVEVTAQAIAKHTGEKRQEADLNITMLRIAIRRCMER